MSEVDCLAIVDAVTPKDQTVRDKLASLEAVMRQYPQTVIPERHYFAKGLYAREITIPKGTLLTGKIHKTEHLNIVSKGEISVLTEEGPKRVKAPFTMVAPPGTKRAGYAHEETVWTTIHSNVTNETDLEKLEAVLIAPDYAFEQLGIVDAIAIEEVKS